MNRAYTILEIKSLDEEQRLIEGIASTPTVDRVGDEVVPEGANFKLPMPFLWQHDSSAPIGHVTHATVRKDGIKVAIKIPKIFEAGRLKDRIDEAWQSLRAGLVGGLSIGFTPTEYEPIKDGKGFRFLKWDWLELSAVTVPANSECNIQLIRSMDQDTLAAIGRKARSVPLSVRQPGVAGNFPQHRVSGNNVMRTLSEQIEALEATRAAKAAQQATVMTRSIEEGRSTDPAEAEEVDALEQEIEALDADLRRLHAMEQRNAQSARPIAIRGASALDGEVLPPLANGQRAPLRPWVQVVKREFEPGIEFARYVMAVAAGRGNLSLSAEIAASNYGSDSDVAAVVKSMARIGSSGNLEIIDRFQKAAVGTSISTDDDWAAPLVFAYPRFSGDFVEYLRPRTILGQLTGLTRIPFNVNIAGQSSGGTAYWVGEAKPKPLTSFHFNSVNFRWAKIATISVLSDEMVRFSNPSAEVLVRDELAKAIGERMDIDFVDPGKAASTNVSPASITNGVTPSHSAGNTGDFIRSDVSTLLGGFDNYDIPLTNPAFIMSSTKARQLTLMRNSLGQREFPDMTLLGGSLEGIPVVASRYVSKFGTTGGEYVMLIHQPDIWYADDGQVTVDASREASLEMLDGSLTQDASGGTGASLVSMFQTNSVAVRAERYVNWARRRTGAVVVLDMCFWGSSHTSGT